MSREREIGGVAAGRTAGLAVTYLQELTALLALPSFRPWNVNIIKVYVLGYGYGMLFRAASR